MPVPDMPKRAIQCLSQICPKGSFSDCQICPKGLFSACPNYAQICPKGLLSACPNYAQSVI
ncbi:MAG: hypothetical protein HFJ36_04185 [Clostridia bacterium]|nr:hypothetical protein [Clostridia bacterium]